MIGLHLQLALDAGVFKVQCVLLGAFCAPCAGFVAAGDVKFFLGFLRPKVGDLARCGQAQLVRAVDVDARHAGAL